MDVNPLITALQPLIDAIADAVSERQLRAQQRMIPQGRSDLSPKRHREAVKRRIANGEGGAGIDGRKYLLTREAMLEELARPHVKKPKRGGSGGSESGSKDAPAPKSRARELSEFERDLMNGLRNVE